MLTMELLLNWCKENGVFVHENVEIGHVFPETGRGLRCVKPIPKNTVLIRVPKGKYLQPSKDEGEDSFYDIILKEHPSLSPWVMQVLVLMHEYLKPDSLFKDYFQTVDLFTDEKPNHLIFSDTTCEKALRGTAAEFLMQVGGTYDHGGLGHLFDTLAHPIIQAHPSFFSDKADLLLFKRCAAAVASRAFESPLREGPHIVPVADLLNHNRRACAVVVSEDDTGFTVTSTRALIRDEEIFNTYGDLSNAQLLYSYGFVEKTTPWDNVIVPHLALTHARCMDEANELAFSVIEARLAALVAAGVIPPEICLITRTDMIPDELLTAVQVLYMSPDEWTAFQKQPKLLGEGYEVDEPIYYAALLTLRRIVYTKLKAYTSTLTADVALLKRDRASRYTQLAPLLRTCVQLRAIEKQLLNFLADQLEEDLTDLAKELHCERALERALAELEITEVDDDEEVEKEKE